MGSYISPHKQPYRQANNKTTCTGSLPFKAKTNKQTNKPISTKEQPHIHISLQISENKANLLDVSVMILCP